MRSHCYKLSQDKLQDTTDHLAAEVLTKEKLTSASRTTRDAAPTE